MCLQFAWGHKVRVGRPARGKHKWAGGRRKEELGGVRQKWWKGRKVSVERKRRLDYVQSGRWGGEKYRGTLVANRKI